MAMIGIAQRDTLITSFLFGLESQGICPIGCFTLLVPAGTTGSLVIDKESVERLCSGDEMFHMPIRVDARELSHAKTSVRKVSYVEENSTSDTHCSHIEVELENVREIGVLGNGTNVLELIDGLFQSLAPDGICVPYDFDFLSSSNLNLYGTLNLSCRPVRLPVFLEGLDEAMEHDSSREEQNQVVWNLFWLLASELLVVVPLTPDTAPREDRWAIHPYLDWLGIVAEVGSPTIIRQELLDHLTHLLSYSILLPQL
jgi:hypothetical protein